MERRPEGASVQVEKTGEGWVVHVAEAGATADHDFPTAEAAEDFAHSQRLRLGIVPQQDMS